MTRSYNKLAVVDKARLCRICLLHRVTPGDKCRASQTIRCRWCDGLHATILHEEVQAEAAASANEEVQAEEAAASASEEVQSAGASINSVVQEDEELKEITALYISRRPGQQIRLPDQRRVLEVVALPEQPIQRREQPGRSGVIAAAGAAADEMPVLTTNIVDCGTGSEDEETIFTAYITDHRIVRVTRRRHQ